MFGGSGLATGALCAESGIDRLRKMRRHDLDEPAVIGREAVGRGRVERQHGDERVTGHEREAEAPRQRRCDRVHARAELEGRVGVDDRLASVRHPSSHTLADRNRNKR